MDRLPPQELDAEKALLGACLVSEQAMDEARTVLTKTDAYYVPAHRMLWNFLLDYSELGGPRDLITVAKALRDRDELEALGGEEYLIHLGESFADTANVIYYAQIVMRAAELRALISLGNELREAAWSIGAQPDDLIARYSTELNKVGETQDATTYEARELLHEIKVRDPSDDSEPIKTGLKCYDDFIGGLEPGAVTVLAAYPSTGKTAFGMFLCCNLVDRNSLFVSVEMRHEQLRYRLAASLSRYSISEIKRGTELSISNIVRLSEEKLGNKRIWIADRVKKIGQIVSLARNYHRQHNLALVVIDYLQLCLPDKRNDSRNLEVAEMSAAVKTFAQDTGCAVLLLSQLSREAAKQKRKPTLQDLRDSGAIEQDADVVWFLQRADDGDSEVWDITWYVAKNRLGPIRPEGFPLRFDRPRMDFMVGT